MPIPDLPVEVEPEELPPSPKTPKFMKSKKAKEITKTVKPPTKGEKLLASAKVRVRVWVGVWVRIG